MKIAKKMLWLLVIPALLIIAMAGLSCASRRGAEPAGLADDRLAPCPDSPNCVSSEAAGTGRDSAIAPFAFEGAPDAAWERLKRAIRTTGGRIEREDADAGYIWATYRTRVWKFVDDVEFRLDADADVIHVRSASRVGHSDLGKNRKRVEHIRRLFNAP